MTQMAEGITSGTVTRYIEAVSGKEFFIRVGFAKFFKPKQNAVAVDVHMDGQHCNVLKGSRDTFEGKLLVTLLGRVPDRC